MKEAAPNNKLLAIASVPYQSWECVYSFDDALTIGTIFPELNMPFFAAETPCPQPMEKGECPLPKDNKTLLAQIKFGGDTGLIHFAEDFHIYELMMAIQPYSLQCHNGKYVGSNVRDKLRAEYLNANLPQLLK
mgnify:CR=1 FL=1